MLTRGDLPDGRWLSPRIKFLWYLEIAPALVAIPALIFFTEYLLLPQLLGQGMGGQFDLALVPIFILSLFIPYGIAELRYKKFIYAMGQKDLTIKRGVVEKLRYVVPYEKIQDVTVSRSPLELLLGIGTVHIETAGHKAVEGEITLPGIEDYNGLVNQLIEESKLAKEAEAGDDDSKTVIRLLSAINSNIERLAQLAARDGGRRAMAAHQRAKEPDPGLRGPPLLGDDR